MPRYFVKLSYDGTNYHGWQVQPNAITVQEAITDQLKTATRRDVELVGAGRTDTGVHAKNYIAHFDSDMDDLENADFLFKMNCLLPKDIVFHKIQKVRDDAHARFDALSRSYEYNILKNRDPFREKYTWVPPYKLNYNKMNIAAQILMEYKDYTSFSKLHTDVKTNNCNLIHARWVESADGWTFFIKADRFLRNMVRAIIGTLVEVGRGKISIADFRTIVEAKNRSDAGPSVPAKALFFVGAEYPSEEQL